MSVARGSHVWLRNVARCESTSARVTIWLNGSAVVAVLPPVARSCGWTCGCRRASTCCAPAAPTSTFVATLWPGCRGSGPERRLRSGAGARRALEYHGPPAAAAPDAGGADVDDGVEEIYTPSIQREMGIHTGLEEDEDEDDWESLSSGLEEYDDEDEESGEDGAEFLPFDGMGGGIYFD